MTAQPGPDQPIAGVFRWNVYSPEHKVDLTALVVESPAGWVIFDPIPPVLTDWEAQFPRQRPTALVVTNANHARAGAEARARWSCPIYGPAELGDELPLTRTVVPPECPLPGWETFSLIGGAPGETAWILPARSLVIFGDAVVNLPTRGLELLPDKYCTDPAQLRTQLRLLLARDFARALFAHGTPLVTDATARLRALL